MQKYQSILMTIIVLPAILICGCKKDNNNNTATVLTKEQILVQKTWQVDEVLRNISGTNSHYVRGGVNTTGVNYDLIRITFNANGTGTYIDEVGTSHTTTWSFTTPDKHNMQFSIGAPFAQTFTWNLVEVTETSLDNTTAVGSNVLVASRFIQIP